MSACSSIIGKRPPPLIIDEEDSALREPGVRRHSDAELDRELYDSSKEGILDKVEELLGKGADPDSVHGEGIWGDLRTSLMEACDWGHDEVVELLLRGKADLEKISSRGKTALKRAAKSWNICSKLLKRGASRWIPKSPRWLMEGQSVPFLFHLIQEGYSCRPYCVLMRELQKKHADQVIAGSDMIDDLANLVSIYLEKCSLFSNFQDADGKTVLHWVSSPRTYSYLQRRGARAVPDLQGNMPPLHRG